MEQYLKGNKEPEIDEEYQNFRSGLPKILDQFTEVLWAESPVLDRFKFTLGCDDIARVWGADEQGRAWAGAPDIIAVVNNKLTLADLKQVSDLTVVNGRKIMRKELKNGEIY